jgi:hypothetical protein
MCTTHTQIYTNHQTNNITILGNTYNCTCTHNIFKQDDTSRTYRCIAKERIRPQQLHIHPHYTFRPQVAQLQRRLGQETAHIVLPQRELNREIGRRVGEVDIHHQGFTYRLCVCGCCLRVSVCLGVCYCMCMSVLAHNIFHQLHHIRNITTITAITMCVHTLLCAHSNSPHLGIGAHPCEHRRVHAELQVFEFDVEHTRCEGLCLRLLVCRKCVNECVGECLCVEGTYPTDVVGVFIDCDRCVCVEDVWMCGCLLVDCPDRRQIVVEPHQSIAVIIFVRPNIPIHICSCVSVCVRVYCCCVCSRMFVAWLCEDCLQHINLRLQHNIADCLLIHQQDVCPHTNIHTHHHSHTHQQPQQSLVLLSVCRQCCH